MLYRIVQSLRVCHQFFRRILSGFVCLISYFPDPTSKPAPAALSSCQNTLLAVQGANGQRPVSCRPQSRHFSVDFRALCIREYCKSYERARTLGITCFDREIRSSEGSSAESSTDMHKGPYSSRRYAALLLFHIKPLSRADLREAKARQADIPLALAVPELPVLVETLGRRESRSVDIKSGREPNCKSRRPA